MTLLGGLALTSLRRGSDLRRVQSLGWVAAIFLVAGVDDVLSASSRLSRQVRQADLSCRRWFSSVLWSYSPS